MIRVPVSLNNEARVNITMTFPVYNEVNSFQRLYDEVEAAAQQRLTAILREGMGAMVCSRIFSPRNNPETRYRCKPTHSACSPDYAN